MKRVAFTHDIFPGGGAERVTIDIAKFLYEQYPDYKCYVFTPKIVEELYTDEVKRYITVVEVSLDKSKRSEDIERLVKAEGINLIVQVVQPIRHIQSICKRCGCKTILANHGEPFWERHSVIRRRQKSLLYKPMWRLYWKRHFIDKNGARNLVIKRVKRQYACCDAYTVLCEDYRQEVCQALGITPDTSKVVAIENSERIVDNVNYDKEKIILFCGRLENTPKRLDRLLRIWGKVQDRLTEYRLLIVGDGNYRAAMEDQIIREGLKRVDMVGRHSDVEQFYRKASIVCLTSQTEGWPLCLTEGQAHGCITIAFGCSAGVRDILSPSGTNGFVVTPFDEDEYAETFIHIASMSDEERDKIRRSSVAKRMLYAPNIIMKKWVKLFESLLNDN